MFTDAPVHAALSLFFNPIPALHSAYGQEGPQLFPWIESYRPQPMTAEVVIGEHLIRDIAALPKNWDGYGALPVSAEAATNAGAVLAALLPSLPLPDITPNPNGTVSMEWETQNGLAHLELGATRYSFFLKPRSGASVYAEGDADDHAEKSLGSVIVAMLFPSLQSKWATTSYQIATGHVRAS